jgi:anti-anti-sigma factor
MESRGDRPADWDRHIVLVHENERQRRQGVAAWVRAGLRQGAKVIYIEPADEPAERSFRGLLEEHAVDADDAFGSGQLELFEASDAVYSPTWQDSKSDEALSQGYPSVRWSGEEATAWGVMPPAAHADVEWATDELCRTRPVSVLCQYSSRLPQATLQTVCAMHGGGLREAQLSTTFVPGGLALAGAVDASNERLLRCALMAATATTTKRGGCMVVDLGRLEFLDVSGAKALLTGTTDHRLKNGSVRLRAPQPPVEQLLRLLGADTADGFELEVAR